MIAMKVWE